MRTAVHIYHDGIIGIYIPFYSNWISSRTCNTFACNILPERVRCKQGKAEFGMLFLSDCRGLLHHKINLSVRRIIATTTDITQGKSATPQRGKDITQLLFLCCVIVKDKPLYNYLYTRYCAMACVDIAHACVEDDDDQSISDFWGECIQSKKLDLLKSFRSKNDNRIFGLCSELKEDSTSFVYALAVVVPDDFDFAKAPKDFTKWQVEKSRYVIFDCYGKDGDCISKAWENYFQNFLPQSGMKTKEAPDFEIYFDDGDPDLMCELWIPVKKED